MRPWLFDEAVPVGTDYRDPGEVAAYDRHMQTLRDVGAEAVDIRRALALTRDSVVWEIGTGTGECALRLAAAVRHVHATDVSPAMLAFARDKAQQRAVRNVTFEAGGFLSGFRPPTPVDAVVSQLALHHLPDFWKARALDGIARALRPGGRLYLRDVVFPSSVEDYDAFFRTAIDGVRARAGDRVAGQTIQHIKTEYSTLDWILEGMLVRAGLEIVEKSASGFLAAYVVERRPPGFASRG